MKPNTIFIHIPKCGGSTLNGVIEREFRNKRNNVWNIKRTDDIIKFIALPEDRRQKIRVLIGHGRYGLHEHLFGPSRYMTFLRNPIDRALSAYYYTKSFNHLPVRKYDLSLYEYYKGDYGPWDKNIATKKIAGVNNDIAPCTDDMYELAKQNLEINIEFVGFLEYFDESLVLLRDLFNWRISPYYRRKNVTRHRKKLNSISAEEMDLLNEVNAYDVELYAYAKKMWLDRILDDSVRIRAERFRRINRIAGYLTDLIPRLKRKAKQLL